MCPVRAKVRFGRLRTAWSRSAFTVDLRQQGCSMSLKTPSLCYADILTTPDQQGTVFINHVTSGETLRGGERNHRLLPRPNQLHAAIAHRHVCGQPHRWRCRPGFLGRDSSGEAAFLSEDWAGKPCCSDHRGLTSQHICSAGAGRSAIVATCCGRYG